MIYFTNPKLMNAIVDQWVATGEAPSIYGFCRDGKKYIGLDNRSGDCWVDEFDTLADCLAWLTGEYYMTLKIFMEAV